MNQIKMYSTLLKKEGIEKREYSTGLIKDRKNEEMCVVNLYPNKEYQVVEGFGGALTESAAYAISKLSQENRQKIIQAYYGKDGIGYTLGRVHMDSCDFSLENYCAVNNAKDSAFKDFSLKRAAKYVEPLVKMVLETSEQPVRLLMSPWSPPAFMKTTGVRNGGGHLKKECYQPYANYIVKYIQEYQNLGVTIHSLTIQNEPLAVQLWDSCEYTAEEEKVFLRDFLYPALEKAGMQEIEIYIWDHNKERVYERVCDIVDDSTRDKITGVAFHWYSGDHFETLSMVREDFPDLKLMHSEGCVEIARYQEKAGDVMAHAEQYIHDIIGNLNHGMNSWIDWNLALDEEGGPNHVFNYCSAPLICDTVCDKVIFQPVFFAIAHFSKYIQPGAVRIGFSKYSKALEITAFKNPDKTIAVVMYNNGEECVVQLRIQGKVAKLVIPGKSIETIIISNNE